MEEKQKEMQGKLLESLRADGYENSAALVEEKIRDGKWLSILAMSRDEWVNSKFNLSELFADEIVTMLGEEKKDELINFLKTRDFKGAIDQVEKLFTMNRWNVVLATSCGKWVDLGIDWCNAVKIVEMLGEAKQNELLQFLKSEASSKKLNPTETTEADSYIEAIELSIKVLHQWYLMLTYTRADWAKCGVPNELTGPVVNLIKGDFYQPRSTQDSSSFLSYYEEEFEKLREAFESPYRRDADSNVVDSLSKYINESFQKWRDNSSDICSPYIAMIQASGTGKTRAVEQLSLSRWLVYVCFRKKNAVGYPLGSPDSVTKFLMTANTSDWTQFFSATTAIIIYLDATSNNASETKRLKVSEIPFQDCVKKAVDRCFGSGFTFAKEEFFHDLAVDRGQQGEDFANRFWSAVFELVGILQRKKVVEVCKWPEETPLVFAFDEARALLPGDETNEKSSPLYRMRTSIAEKNTNCLVLLVDTSAKVASVSEPPASRYSWMKAAEENQKLLQPFVFMEKIMNCCVDALPRTLMEVVAEDYLLKIGRPLWTKGCYTSAEQIVLFARTKLKYPPSTGSCLDHYCEDLQTALAVLGPRTQIHPRSCAVTYGEELVSNRSALLLRIYRDRFEMKVRYWAEPVLAAASFIQMSDRQFVFDALNKIQSSLANTEALSARDLGQFVARFIAIWCWDEIVDPPHTPRDLEQSSRKPRRSMSSLYSPEPLKAWLENFVGSETVQELKQKFEESRGDIDSSKFEAVLNGKILLTHFAPCFDDLSEDCSDLLLDLICKGAAGCFVNKKRYIDWILPIVVGDEKTELTLDNVSFIAVQVINQTDDVTPAGADYLHHLQSRMLNEYLKHPMISILFVVNGNDQDRVSCSVYNPTKEEIEEDEYGPGFLSIEVRGLTALPFNKRFGEAATLLADCARWARDEIETEERFCISYAYHRNLCSAKN